MKKSFIVITFLICSVTVSLAFFQSAARYENLKVLPKNTNKYQMDSVMKHFSSSLGVKCNFCHVRNNDEKKDWNFASDENKHKDQARYMMKMTQKINKRYFKDDGGNAITCHTCHNGKEEPVAFPAPKQEGSK
jgi:uncharacterized protein YxeA